MVFKKTVKLLLFTAITLFIMSCGSSTATRYENGKEKNSKHAENSKNLNENFDISPYKTKIDLKTNEKPITIESIDAWYDYNTSIESSGNDETVMNTVNGFRVQVLSTDDLANADSLRSELYNKINQNHIYIIFDPPFYRIEVGDFTQISAANDLKFKLNQLGYSEARVVNEKVNIYK
jgi:hypothetical protein